jgi:hypothetical protein
MGRNGQSFFPIENDVVLDSKKFGIDALLDESFPKLMIFSVASDTRHGGTTR